MAFHDAIVLVHHMKKGSHRLVVGNAFRICTFDDRLQFIRHLHLFFFHDFIVADNVQFHMRSHYRDTVEEMGLTPGKSTVVGAPLIEESPLCIECRVKEILSLGSHDMFIADVVNVRADERHLNAETGKLELAEANPLVYVHGGYYELGNKIGKFGWSVEKKR